MSNMNAEEVARIQNYLQNKFQNNGFALKFRDKVSDSVEVLLNGEFIGVIYKDEDEGELSYDFNMSILEIDYLHFCERVIRSFRPKSSKRGDLIFLNIH